MKKVRITEIAPFDAFSMFNAEEDLKRYTDDEYVIIKEELCEDYSGYTSCSVVRLSDGSRLFFLGVKYEVLFDDGQQSSADSLWMAT